MRVSTWICCAVLAVPGLLPAQIAPQPGSPEIKRLEFYVGKWEEGGRSRTDPSAEFRKLTGEESCEWFPGGLSVVCRETTTDSSGRTEALYILTYNSAQRVYGVAGVDSTGNVYGGTGVLEGGVWTWDVDATAGDAAMRQRYRFRPEGPAQRSMEIEIPKSDGSWQRVAEVTYRRKKSS